MSKKVIPYTVALVGDVETSELNSLVKVFAQNLKSFGRVLTGDYLDKKNIGKKASFFHIGCYKGNALVDLISCPLTRKNVGLALAQSDRVIWILSSEDLNDNFKNAVVSAKARGISLHSLIVNTAHLAPEIKDDKELLDLVLMEAREFFDEIGVELEHNVTVSASKTECDFEVFQKLSPLGERLFDSPRTLPRMDEFEMWIEQCYSIARTGIKPMRVGFGPLRGGTIRIGQLLTLKGFMPNDETLRVFEIQLFGESVENVPQGCSVAVLFQGGPKNMPKDGQVLVEKPNAFEALTEFGMRIKVLEGDSIGEVLAGKTSLDLCIGTIDLQVVVTDFVTDVDKQNQSSLKVKCSSEIPIRAGQHVLLGAGESILAIGEVLES